MVPGLVWALFINKRDKPHRTHDWFVPFVARRLLGQRLQRLPRVAARRRLARRPLLPLHRVPYREDSVVPFSLGLFRGLRRGGLAYSAAFANPQFVTPLFTGKNRSFLDHFCPQAKQAKGV